MKMEYLRMKIRSAKKLEDKVITSCNCLIMKYVTYMWTRKVIKVYIEIVD